MHGLAVHVKKEFTLARDLSLENSAESYLSFRLAFLHSVSSFFFLYRSPSSLLCTVFYSISSNIDEVHSINPYGNVFVFGDFNVHHKDWFTCSGGTARPGELGYNFYISNELTQIINVPTRIPDCGSHSLALLDLFLSSGASICSAMTFPPLGNSDHVVFSAFIDSPINSKQDALFNRAAYDYLVLIEMVFVIIWEMFLGRISLNAVLLLQLMNFVGGFRLELMYISLLVSIRSNITHVDGFQQLVLLL